MKSRQNAILLSDRTNFFPSSQNIDKSVSTQHFSKYTALFPKKREKISLSFGKNKSKFWIVNLRNGGTKDFGELWEIIHLKN